MGIEPHDAPADDFPKQPSQKDGLGRMCKTHWNQYTAGLARDAKARKAAAASDAASEPATANVPETEAAAQDEPERPRKRKSTKTHAVIEAPPVEGDA